MEKFIKHTGTGVPLRRSNVDTDQIIPAVYLKRVTRSGFEDGLFAAWRNDPDFVLNQEVEALWSAIESKPDTAITVDLETRTVSYDSTVLNFAIDDYTRWRLMEGLDDIGLTLKQTDSIDAFEKTRAEYKPKTLPILK